MQSPNGTETYYVVLTICLCIGLPRRFYTWRCWLLHLESFCSSCLSAKTKKTNPCMRQTQTCIKYWKVQWAWNIPLCFCFLYQFCWLWRWLEGFLLQIFTIADIVFHKGISEFKCKNIVILLTKCCIWLLDQSNNTISRIMNINWRSNTYFTFLEYFTTCSSFSKGVISLVLLKLLLILLGGFHLGMSFIHGEFNYGILCLHMCQYTINHEYMLVLVFLWNESCPSVHLWFLSQSTDNAVVQIFNFLYFTTFVA